MPDRHDRVSRARLATAEAQRVRQQRVQEAAEAADKLTAIERAAGPNDPRREHARAELAARTAALESARTQLAGSMAALADAVRATLPAEPGSEWQKLDARFPAVLLPVRIETRFARDAAGRDELRVRVYPDSLFLESHDAALTTAEQDAGQAYWKSAWPEATEAESWRALVRTLPAPRAAWVVLATTPENLDERPAGEPRFPPIELCAGAWDRAPQATLLPDRWLLVGYRGGAAVRQAAGRPVREPLALGFDPHAAGDAEVDVSDDGLVLDDELAWTVDFERALDAGMALRVPLSADDARLGFDRVFVVGVKASLPAEDAAAALQRLLDDHHYTGGLALIPQGTPTNNTEAGSAGFPPADPDGQVSFAVERGAPLDREGGDGGKLAAALGVSPASFAHVGGAAGAEQERGQAMNRAVFPITLGYFLRQMMAPYVSEDAIADALEHFVAWVRGRGPLPALRARRQPYGLLPVSSIQRWEVDSDAHGLARELPALLGRLRTVWLVAAAQAPRIGRTTDADADLIEVLALHPSSREVRVRSAQGPAWQVNLIAYLGLDADAWRAEQKRLVGSMMHPLVAADWQPKVLSLTFADSAGRYRHPLVAPPPLSETRALDPDYVRWVRQATVAELKDEIWPDGAAPPRTLLYQVLRHARLEELARVAVGLHIANGAAASEARDRELVGIAGSDPPTRLERLVQPVPAVSGEAPIGEFLLKDQQHDASRPVRDHSEALAALEGVPTAELDRLFSECLDLGSHRLDAWLTSLATARLAEMRTLAPAGAHLGAFGWVEDLRPADGGRASDGYVLAPSLDHAAAASVLRSGYLTRNVPGTGAYAIDLSSARVREGLAILDAARDGEPAGAVLGARFERALREHPRRLARFIEPLRRGYPLAAGKGDSEAEPPEVQAARAVVDGIALRRAYLDDELDLAGPDFTTGDAARDAADRAAVKEELDALDRSIDALADLLLAESVYQAVSGTPSGAAATLDTMARGTVSPEPAIAGQARSAIPIHHRVVLLLGGEPAPPPGWPAAPTPRAQAEPRIDVWLGRQLGDPRRVRCRAAVTTPAGGDSRTVDITLADLGLRPIDVLALADALPGDGGPEAELELRVLDAARAGDASAGVTVAYGRDPGDSPDEVATFPEILELARALAKVLARCRPLAARDLVTPVDAPKLAPEGPVAEAQARADGARAAVAAVGDALAAAQSSGDPSVLAAALDAAARCGIPGAYPRAGKEIDQAPAAAAEIARRLAAADAASDPTGAATALFGTAFPFVPSLAPQQPDELGKALERSDAVTGSAEARTRWLAQASRARPALGRWRRAALLAETLGTSPLPTAVAQLPVRDGARWAALPFESGAAPVGGTFSLMLLGALLPAAERWAGLVLDEWPELIAEPESTTGVAFHFDTPGAEVPQCVLIAVPPRRGPTWHLDDILGILGETLDLARIRAVDLELLGSLGQLLPATYLAANAAGDTVSTSFAGALVSDGQRVVNP